MFWYFTPSYSLPGSCNKTSLSRESNQVNKLNLIQKKRLLGSFRSPESQERKSTSRPKRCPVCKNADNVQLLSFSYGAWTCPSCRGFFHRWVVTGISSWPNRILNLCLIFERTWNVESRCVHTFKYSLWILSHLNRLWFVIVNDTEVSDSQCMRVQSRPVGKEENRVCFSCFIVKL